MIHLLLVSHSFQLASGVAALARQMVDSPTLKILVAAGIGDEHEEIGTNALEIEEALSSLAQEEGVLVLMDLGSAVLSAKMALEMLDEKAAAKVCLCSAPFVEGAIAAAVKANGGAGMAEVYREAMSALAPKTEQIPEPVFAEALADASAMGDSDTAVLVVKVPNKTGLHARPAAAFAKEIAAYKGTKVTVTNRNGKNTPVAITGVIAVMLLAAKQGDELLIEAQGPDRDKLIAALKALFEANLGDPE